MSNARETEHDSAGQPAKPARAGWQPVFSSDEEMWEFLNDFRNAVAPDIKELRQARQRGEALAFDDFIHQRNVMR